MSTLNQFSYPLYSYAVGYFKHQPVNPLDFLAPAQSTEGGLMGTYKLYPQGYAFRAVNTRRAPHTPATTVDIHAQDVPYMLEDHGLRIAIDDSELKPGAGNRAEAAEQLAQSKIDTLLATWRTSAIEDGFAAFRAQVPAKASVGAWSGASADPIDELKAIIREYRLTNGVVPNRMLFSYEAWDILAANAAVLSRITYNDAQELTAELLIKLLGFSASAPDAPKILRASVPVGVDKPAPGLNFEGRDVLGSEVWLTYVDEGSTIGNMCGLRTFHAGGGSPVESVESYYERAEHTTYYEVNMHRFFAVTAPSCVVRLSIS